MIDALEEEIWTLDRAAEFAQVNRSNIYAWTRKGCRGVILSSIQIGAKRFTSKEAMARFVTELNDPKRVARLREKTGGYVRSQKKRREEARKAAERLEKAGC